MGIAPIRTVSDLLAKARWDGECLIWLGNTNKDGYGAVQIDKHEIGTHRLMWALVYGPVPTGLFVCHTCDKPICFWPEHLWLGTPYQNHLDMRLKNRGANPWNGIGISRPKKLDKDRVRSIKNSLTAGATQISIAQQYGIDQTLVSQIKLGKIWSHV
jgi:hypothetical protein